jgi:uncharacterized phage protein gp47/JayE
MTYEAIIARMISRITDKYPELDIREGSMVFNACASAAMELAIMYVELDNVLKESFMETATRKYLLIGCEQMGIDTSIFNASAGIFKGVFNVPVDLDSRWNLGEYNYIVTEQLETEDDMYIYRLQCEMFGSEPNVILGDLTPIDSVSGDLTVAKITECLIEGEEENSDEEIRTTYFNYVNSIMSDGNVAQYKQWCEEYDGIGNYKVMPLWNGANTVKVSILSSSNERATDELVSDFQEYLDPNSEGMGNGIAPIGAIVTVSTATHVPITISADVTLKDGYTETTLLDKALEDYFKEIAYETTRVSYMSVGAAILKAEGVDFISNLRLNGSTNDITLGKEEILTLGSANWTVINDVS